MKLAALAPACVAGLVICPGGVLLSNLAAAEAASSGRVLEEIIVTARKREESAQNVPVAITALSEELARSTVRDLTDLNGFAPNVYIAQDTSRSGGSSITIRGISPTRTDDNSFDSPIAVMIDGVYLGTLSGQILENFDLERVEILRGPQGTLFGKNTVGGVVHVIRSRPTGEWGARFKYTIGKWDQQELRAVVNAPVIEGKLAAKVFLTDLEDDGYIRNTFSQQRVPRKDYMNYGLTLLATPVDSFEAQLTVERFDDDSQGGASLTNWNLAPGVAEPPADSRETDVSGGFLSCTLFNSGGIPQWSSGVPCRTDLAVPGSVATDLPNPSSFEVDAYTLNMSWDLSDSMKLVSVTGYRDMVENRKLDFDGSEADFITIERLNDYDQLSQELRLEGAWNNVTFVAGVHYWDSEFSQDWVTGGDFWTFVGSLSGYDLRDNTWILGGALVPADPASGERMAFESGLSPLEGCLAELFGNVRCDTGAGPSGLGDKYVQRLYETQQTESIALFAQADWEFVENWTLTAGLRWTREEKDFTAGQAYLAPVGRQYVKNFPEFADLDNSWNDVSPKLGLSYQLSGDVLLFASYAEGFHSGGFFGVNQNVADFERDQYDPEFANSYEAGIKSQWLENRVQLNATYFYNDFEDKQEQAVAFDATTNTVATVFANVADARYHGLEVEGQAVIHEYVSLFASVGWLDAEYRNFVTDINPNDGVTVLEDASFLRPRNAPEYTYGIGGTFSYPIGPGQLEVWTKYNWVDEIETSLLNLDVGRLDSREDWSASLGYRFEGIEVTLFGRNLTDEQFEVPTLIHPLFASGSIIPGRSWGLEVGIDL